MKSFDDIRPFRDAEVSQVVERLLHNESLVQIMIHLQFPVVSKYIEKPLAKLVRRRIAQHLQGVKTIADFQQLMFQFVASVIQKSMTGFSYSGIEHLDPGQSYVFISNHRDITLDSALLNYVLMQTGMHTAEIAIGDNLLSNPLMSDLLRLNKSFIVKRSVPGLKAKLAALMDLSGYISQTRELGNSIWIAQREGRAKDGCDRTDPAIIKMLHIHNKKQQVPFAESIRRLNIVPVAIAYEYDPCDILKATEMQAREEASYVKREGEDVESIMRGIALPKGRVHIQFCPPLQDEYADANAVAAVIDQRIVAGYRLFPSNILAYEQLQKLRDAMINLQEESRQRWLDVAAQARQALATLDAQELARQANEFSARIAGYPKKVQSQILEMYANPLLSKYQLESHIGGQPA